MKADLIIHPHVYPSLSTDYKEQHLLVINMKFHLLTPSIRQHQQHRNGNCNIYCK